MVKEILNTIVRCFQQKTWPAWREKWLKNNLKNGFVNRGLLGAVAELVRFILFYLEAIRGKCEFLKLKQIVQQRRMILLNLVVCYLRNGNKKPDQTNQS